MRKIYKCKFCRQQTSIYDSINAANSPLLSCPKCGNSSDNTAIEGWVESISFRSFDEDIEESCKNGTINLLFGRDLCETCEYDDFDNGAICKFCIHNGDVSDRYIPKTTIKQKP